MKIIQTNYTTKSPIFFDVDKTFNDCIANHNKKFEIYLVGVVFKLDFDNNLNAHVKTDFL